MKENVGPASEKVNLWERGWRARVERLDFVRGVFIQREGMQKSCVPLQGSLVMVG